MYKILRIISDRAEIFTGSPGYMVILSIRLDYWNYRVLRLAIAQIPALNEFIEFET